MTFQTKLLKKQKMELDYSIHHYLGYIQNFVINANKIPEIFFTLDNQFRTFCRVYYASNHKKNITCDLWVSRTGSLLIAKYQNELDTSKLMTFEKFEQFEKEHEFFAWNGENVSNELTIFFDNPIKTKRIFQIENTEIRREALKRVGIKKIFKNFETKIIDYNDKGEMLFDIFFTQKDDDNYLSMRWMYVRDGTNTKEFFLLHVPETWFPSQGEPIHEAMNIVTLHIARAWSFRKHPTEFNPENET